MGTRECDPCTACCQGWITSKHIRMSPGEPCRHCTQQGCAIYEDRPQEPCRSFECGWLQKGSPLPDAMRPDRCGAIVAFNKKCLGIDVFVAAPVGDRIPPPTLNWLMDFARRNALPLLYWENIREQGAYVRQEQSGYGPPSFVQAVKSAGGTVDIMSA
jgi:hypothetical protein